MRALEYQRKPLRISLTPLIDVVFILLLFFMLASTFSQWQQMTMSSISKGEPSESINFPVQVFVLGDGDVRHDGEIYHLDGLDFSALLDSFLSDKSHLLVTAESRASIQDVVLVMDKVVAAGLENVSLTSSFDER